MVEPEIIQQQRKLLRTFREVSYGRSVAEAHAEQHRLQQRTQADELLQQIVGDGSNPPQQEVSTGRISHAAPVYLATPMVYPAKSGETPPLVEENPPVAALPRARSYLRAVRLESLLDDAAQQKTASVRLRDGEDPAAILRSVVAKTQFAVQEIRAGVEGLVRYRQRRATLRTVRAAAAAVAILLLGIGGRQLYNSIEIHQHENAASDAFAGHNYQVVINELAQKQGIDGGSFSTTDDHMLFVSHYTLAQRAIDAKDWYRASLHFSAIDSLGLATDDSEQAQEQSLDLDLKVLSLFGDYDPYGYTQANFTSDNPDGWPTSGSNLLNNGTYSVNVAHGYYNESVPSNASAFKGNTDAVIGATIEPLQGNGEVGLLARYTSGSSGNSMYSCWIDASGNAGCTKIENGSWSYLSNDLPSAPTLGAASSGTNTIVMGTNGDTLEFAVNGQIVFKHTDSNSLPSGDWGVWVSAGSDQVTGVYDQVRILDE